MKKIFFILFAFSLIFSPLVRAQAATGSADLDQLKYILEQAKNVQKTIIEQEEIAAKYPYKIKVVYPNGGENINAGENLRIRWDSVESGLSKINIFLATSTDLYNDKNPGILIARDVPVNSAFYSWTIPENMKAGSFKILLRNSGKYRLSDLSDSDFNIVVPEKKKNALEITSIKGGESFITGRNNKITWKMKDGGERFVNIRLVRSDSSATSTASIPFDVADLLLSSAGGVDWKIPSNISTGEYRLKIFGIDTDCLYCLEPQAKNLSMTEPFKIVNAKDLPKGIIIFTPNGDSDVSLQVTKDEKTTVKLIPVATTTNGVATTTFEWSTTTITTYSTSTEKVSWFTPFDIDSVDIYLRSIPSGKSYLIKNNFPSILSATSSKVELDWAPERLTSADEKVFMRICRTGTNYCDESDKPFAIVASTSDMVASLPTKPEPITAEYNILREIVNKIRAIIEGKSVEEVKVTEEEKISAEPIKNYLPYNFNERLSIGMENSDAVRALQEALTKEGLFDHVITGKFGEVTLKAVQEFQIKYELDPSGSTGPGTQTKLNELYGVKQDILQTVNDLVEAMKATSTPDKVD